MVHDCAIPTTAVKIQLPGIARRYDEGRGSGEREEIGVDTGSE